MEFFTILPILSIGNKTKLLNLQVLTFERQRSNDQLFTYFGGEPHADTYFLVSELLGSQINRDKFLWGVESGQEMVVLKDLSSRSW